jgi:hypothetical protein
MLVVVKVFSDNFPSLSALAEFLSTETPVRDDAEDEEPPVPG